MNAPTSTKYLGSYQDDRIYPLNSEPFDLLKCARGGGDVAHGLVDVVLELELRDVPALHDARVELGRHLPQLGVPATARGRPDVVNLGDNGSEGTT